MTQYDARGQAALLRAQVAAARQAERERVNRRREQDQAQREQQRRQLATRAEKVAADTAELDARVEGLTGILLASLKRSAKIPFASLKVAPALPKWGRSDLDKPEAAPKLVTYMPAALETYLPPPPGAFSKLFSKAKYEQRVEEARAKYETDAARGQQAYAKNVQIHRQREEWRVNELARARAEHDGAVEAAKTAAAEQHREIDRFEAAFNAGDVEAVIAYFTMVLDASEYPSGFPAENFRLAYVPESRQLVCEYELPTVEIVPAVRAYKYVKTSDSVTETARPATQIKSIYAAIVAQVAVRTLHELFSADGGRQVDTVVFNGMVDTIDPGSGQRIRPCLVTVRTTRDVFDGLDLANVEPLACLKHLSAAVSKAPTELVPVRPVLEFNMVDARFVAEGDALSLLDTRPNLMDLTPGEFESLIQNLFTKMGLEARQTRASRDGGVDCVAYDPRPIFGGKVVIQAKRYKHTVGVSAVRDLFGTLQNEGASKGILVTTSGYGSASFDFAQNKPIELIDGAQLLYLLSEHAGIEAKIIAPDDWREPVLDAPDTTEAHIPGTRSPNAEVI